jgi:Na+/phosphate symporter
MINPWDIFIRVIRQVTSGRWIITMAGAFCLIILTKTLCALMIAGKITLETSTSVAVIMSILNLVGTVSIFYFNKDRTTLDDNGNDETTTTTTTLPQ